MVHKIQWQNLYLVVDWFRLIIIILYLYFSREIYPVLLLPIFFHFSIKKPMSIQLTVRVSLLFLLMIRWIFPWYFFVCLHWIIHKSLSLVLNFELQCYALIQRNNIPPGLLFFKMQLLNSSRVQYRGVIHTLNESVKIFCSKIFLISSYYSTSNLIYLGIFFLHFQFVSREIHPVTRYSIRTWSSNPIHH